MSDYAKLTDFAIKDTLPTGDADKRVRGSEIDAEYEALEVAIATKADLASPALTGNPTAPTQSVGNSSTRVATTAFVGAAITANLATVTTMIADAINDNFPIYSIIMWYGSLGAIPTGWTQCNGVVSGGYTPPDLRDRFPIGVSTTYVLGATGGSADAINVSHTHTISITDPGHAHSTNAIYHAGGGASAYGAGDLITAATVSANTTGITASASTTGSSGTNANLPPFQAVHFIMKVANYAA